MRDGSHQPVRPGPARGQPRAGDATAQSPRVDLRGVGRLPSWRSHFVASGVVRLQLWREVRLSFAIVTPSFVTTGFVLLSSTT